MKEIRLSNDKVVLVDDEDYEDLQRFSWFEHTDDTRTTSYAIRNYTRRNDDRVRGSEKMHRRIMKVTDPEIHIDHINGCGLDNRKNNLRIVTRSQNQLNRKLNYNSSTGVKGVSKERSKYGYYSAHYRGKRLYKGLDFFEACCARKSAERNIPKGTEK